MTVDAPLLADLDAGLWLTISAIARRKGKSKQAISKRIKALVEHGLQTRPGDGGAKLVNLAQFDRLVGEVGDAAKEAGAETKAAAAEVEAPGEMPSASPAYRDHQAREKQYSADLKYLELEERLGNLVPVADLAEQANTCAEIVIRIIDRLPTFSEAMAAAVGKDGAAGARARFKDITRELREAAAEAFAKLANEPIEPPPIEETEPDV